MSFMNNIENTLNEQFNVSVTENGALGYRTSGKELLDLNFAISSMRNMSETEIVDKFVKAFYEDKLLAVKWLFFVRDVREGAGERRLFRICMSYIAIAHEDIARAVVKLIPFYGRFDDWFCLFGTDLEADVIELIKAQLEEDTKNMAEGKSISLLAKWLPSVNTSSEETKKLARKVIKALKMRESEYRKMLSTFRSYLKVVEVSMSKGEWGEIDYSAVPARANLIYNDAFLKNDEERRREFLGAVSRGETKINAGVLFPHDIVKKYYANTYECMPRWITDQGLEEAWKALPDFVGQNNQTMCVVDGSGSMMSCLGGTNVTALMVAQSLGIYFAERCTGEFKNKFITFSMSPQLVNLSNAQTLREKLEIASRYREAANTNIEAVFDLILQTAISNHMKQEDLPKNILILSDMEFDDCCVAGNTIVKMIGSYSYIKCEKADKRLFEVIAQRFASHGYKLPRLVFWNICSRTGTIPVKENDMGVALVSGFSPSIARMVISNQTDPFLVLLEQLNAKRYDMVEEALKGKL